LPIIRRSLFPQSDKDSSDGDNCVIEEAAKSEKLMQIPGTNVGFKPTLLLCLSRDKHGLAPKQETIRDKD
jgi:hypothetical protein